jgi:putative DNA primase/helicase
MSELVSPPAGDRALTPYVVAERGVTLLQAAAGYALQGLSVFPCEKKIPLTGSGGFKKATCDAGQIAKWWTENPSAQIGLPTGEVNHLFVVDVDGPEGERAADKLNLPSTFTVRTRPGRFQFWYRQPDGTRSKCTASVIAPQLDTRGDGGYIVAPPSIHHETGKPYQILKNLPWAPAPLDLLEPRKPATSPQTVVTSGRIPQGQRHQTLLSVAGALRARKLSPEMILAQLQIVNERQCVPPLDNSELIKLAHYVGSKAAGFPGQRPQESSAEVELESFRDVKAEAVRWLWKRRIPIGKLTLFVGDPGEGKSLVTDDIAARKSTGRNFPDGAPCDVGDVIFLSAEDDAADTIRPRLDAAGADVSRIHRVKAVRVTLSDGGTGESAFNLERDLEKLGDALKKNTSAQLLVIDPISAYMGRVDTHKDAEIRRVLMPLAEMAARLNIAIIAIMHLKKSDASALLRVSGSIGFVAAARVVWGFGEDPDTSGNHVMVAVKNNLAPLGDGLAYRIEASGEVARIVWQPGSVTLDANTVLSSNRNERTDRGARKSEAETWLVHMLPAGEEVPVSKISKAAELVTFSWRTIENVKKDCGVRAVKHGRAWFWVRA